MISRRFSLENEGKRGTESALETGSLRTSFPRVQCSPIVFACLLEVFAGICNADQLFLLRLEGKQGNMIVKVFQLLLTSVEWQFLLKESFFFV